MAHSENKSKDAYIGKEYYDDSSYFDKQTSVFMDLNNPFQQYRISNVLKIYTPQKNERVLDLGCGWGTFVFLLAPSCKEVIGLDFSSKSIDLCNEFLEKDPQENIKFICADAADTDLEAESFDLIISADLFEHIYPEDFERIIDECQRLLKPGGKLSIWTPHRGHILEILKNNNIILKRDIAHVDYKTMDGMIASLKKKGFAIKKSYYAESHVPILRTIEKLLLKFIPIFQRRIVILAEKQA
ncbi:MAG: class I SAM-dependent methyltransferase [candidate division Zixibacteria bacterium]|nr:class I SAM-dependent methyltransferase [candidate division Zixibacteria bacterium]